MKKYLLLLPAFFLLTACSISDIGTGSNFSGTPEESVDKYLQQAEEAKEKLLEKMEENKTVSFIDSLIPIAHAEEVDAIEESVEELLAKIKDNLEMAVQAAIKNTHPVTVSYLLGDVQDVQTEIMLDIEDIDNDLVQDTVGVIEEIIETIDLVQVEVEDLLNLGEETIEIDLSKEDRKEEILERWEEAMQGKGLSADEIEAIVEQRKENAKKQNLARKTDAQEIKNMVSSGEITREEALIKFFQKRQIKRAEWAGDKYNHFNIVKNTPEKAESFKEKFEEHQEKLQMRFYDRQKMYEKIKNERDGRDPVLRRQKVELDELNKQIGSGLVGKEEGARRLEVLRERHVKENGGTISKIIQNGNVEPMQKTEDIDEEVQEQAKELKKQSKGENVDVSEDSLMTTRERNLERARKMENN